MSPRLTTVALDVHHRLTMPFRVCYRRWLIARGRVPVIVFYYHRVADREHTAWSLTNRQFACQMRWLSRHFEMISMEEAQRRIRSGENRRPAVHITFDDGYAENCDEALPLLVEAQIPCAYFVTLENGRHGHPELARVKNVATLDPRHLVRWGFDYEDTPCSCDAPLPSALRKTAAL